MRDWRPEIVKLVLVKQAIFEVDQGRLWEYHLPGVAATEDQIVDVERRLGYPLPSEYREFLRFANGWRSFYQSVDLFGTADLLDVPVARQARTVLAEYDTPELVATLGSSVDHMLPIAATDVDRDVFLLGTPRARRPGEVVWVAGEVVDRFPGFDEFFLAMVDYNRRELELLRRDLGRLPQ